LEGDGTITVDLSNKLEKRKTARIRIIISLLNHKENFYMLNKIKDYIGGRVAIERKDKYITWIANSKLDVIKVLLILTKYPLLTVKKQCQLDFAKKCMWKKDLNLSQFIIDRNNKYNNKDSMLQMLVAKNNIEDIPSYFPAWLSGFIEAEGNFNLFFNENNILRHSKFSIGQNDEIHILNWIKLYFKSNNAIIKDKVINKNNYQYYRFYLYNKESRILIFEHFDKYPLLGYKNISYKKFYDYHNKNNISIKKNIS